MKSKIVFITCILCSTFMFAQNNDFNFNGLDLLWSNPANWSLNAVPNTTNTGQVRLPLLLESQVDVDVAIKKIQNTFATPGDVPVGGAQTLTINPGTGGAFGIENVSNSDVSLIFKGKVNIDNSAGVNSFTFIRNQNGNTNDVNDIVFESSSTLTLLSNFGVEEGNGGNSFVFNGTLAGNKNLRFGANTTSTFGSTATGIGYTGELVFLLNSSVIVNTADDNIFYNGFKLQVNGSNTSIEINGANVLESRIVVGGGNTFTFTANKNQSNLERINLNNGSTLNLVVGNEVTNISFLENASLSWGTGIVNITGFKEGVIRVGTDNTGLSAGQLSQITADNGGKTLELDANGYLVNVPDYTYSGGSWSPSNPIGVSLATDNIFIENGNPEITGTFLGNSLRIASGAIANVVSTAILDLRGDIINNGSLVFKSDGDGSAQLAAFNGTMLGAGEVTSERFIAGGVSPRRAFRFISPSVNSVSNIRSNWQEDASAWNVDPNPGFGTHITGVEPNPVVNANPDQSQDGDNGFDWQPSGNPSLYMFNASTQSWNNIDNTDINTLEAGLAYRLMVRGNRSTNLLNDGDLPTTTTLRATGSLVSRDVDMSLDLAQGADEISFVGNPYQAVVDFSEVQQNNLLDFIAVWDASLTGTNGRGAYVTVDVSSNTIDEAPPASSSSATKFIAPGQAFFVRNTSAGNPTLIFQEADKTTTEDQVEVFSTNTDFYINSRLYKTEDFLAGNTEVDAIGMRFNSNYTTAATEEDAEKFANPDENYAIINNGLRAIDKQNLPTDGHEIELFINSYTSNEYSLTFDMDNLPEGLGVFLNDTYTGIQSELDQQSVYDFTVDTNIPASMVNNRFQISFGTTTLGVEENAFNGFNLYPNPTKDGRFSIQTNGLNDVNANLSIYNMIGQQVLSETHTLENRSQINVNASRLSTGVYVVQLSQGSNSFVSKLIIE